MSCMSCILLSKVSYLTLCGDSHFQELCEKTSIPLRGLATTLFDLNVKAYKARYGSSIEIEEIEEIEKYPGVDDWVMEYLDNHNTLGLFTLLRRIDYQYGEDGIDDLEDYKLKFAPLFKEARQLSEDNTKEMRNTETLITVAAETQRLSLNNWQFS